MGLGTNDGTLYVKLYKTVLLGFILEITSSVTGRYAIYFKQILIYLFFLRSLVIFPSFIHKRLFLLAIYPPTWDRIGDWAYQTDSI